jgi:hypothetical protein
MHNFWLKIAGGSGDGELFISIQSCQPVVYLYIELFSTSIEDPLSLWGGRSFRAD